MVDFLDPGRGMDSSANTLPFFMRFDEKTHNTVATLVGEGNFNEETLPRPVGDEFGRGSESLAPWERRVRGG